MTVDYEALSKEDLLRQVSVLGNDLEEQRRFVQSREEDLAAVVGLMICQAVDFDFSDWPEDEIPDDDAWLWLDTQCSPPEWKGVATADEAADEVFKAAGRLPERNGS